MKIQSSLPTYSAPPVTEVQLKPSEPAPYIELISPQAPTFPRIKKFFEWLWNWIRSALSYCFPKQVPPIPITPPKVQSLAPTPDILHTIHTAQVKKNTPKPSLLPAKKVVIQKTVGFTISWLVGNIPSFVAGEAVRALTYPIEKIASYTFSTCSPNKIKGGSMSIATALVWDISDRLGYPLGKLFFLGLTFQVVNLYKQSQEQYLLERNRRVLMRVASQAN